MTTISEFIASPALDETVVTNCPEYREKFLKIIEKAGVQESDTKDEQAIKKNHLYSLMELVSISVQLSLVNLPEGKFTRMGVAYSCLVLSISCIDLLGIWNRRALR